MNKFKKGDKVNICDGSYIFGIQGGEYSEYCNNQNGSRNNLTVVKTELLITKPRHFRGFILCDLLVTNNNGSFWFIHSQFCDLVKPSHTIVIDGKTVVLSHKSFLALREQLV